MQHNRDRAILLDMASAAHSILEFKQDMDYRTFIRDTKTQSAVVHQLLVLGEAVKRLSPSFRSAHPQIQWSRIARMRDLMIHQYERVEIEEVWRTAKNDIPVLLSFLEPLLPKRES